MIFNRYTVLNFGKESALYPNDFRKIVRDDFGFCLSCNAFTEKMLLSGAFKPIADVGLMIDVATDRSDVFSNSCCDRGGGFQVRTACNSDAGKEYVTGGEPCKPDHLVVSKESIMKSLSTNGNSYNEWIVKPPHRVMGVFLSKPYFLRWHRK